MAGTPLSSGDHYRPGTVSQDIFEGRNHVWFWFSDLTFVSRGYREKFYPNPSPHSDTSACFQHLRNSYYGFIYEILCLERTHAATQTSTSKKMERYISAYLNDVIQYGAFYLDAAEQKFVLNRVLKRYRQFLSAVYFTGTGSKEFWEYHRGRLTELGYPINRLILLRSGVASALGEAANPGQLFGKIWKRVALKFNRSGTPGRHVGASV